MNDPGLVLIVMLVKFVFVMLLIGWIPAAIARSKGRRFLPWWFYGGGFFLIALIHSLMIKRHAFDISPVTSQSPQEPTQGFIPSRHTWRCGCGELNLAVASECRICHEVRHGQ